MTFYRKYRPRKIADLDLESVVFEIGKLLQGQSLAHAYLFTGPRGSGKTSAARILAKLINCENNRVAIETDEKLNEPCLTCTNCLSIEGGTNLDVIEIDAASNRGIDAIRELKDKIGLSPVSALKKIYIIDEVHMLTTEAFNALLKTLEEPPAHVNFILCTTEVHKVPETIASRCRLVGFKKANPTEVLRSLHKAVEGEKLEIEPDALNRLAAAVDGSFREGHKLLEQLSQGGAISLEAVENLLGIASAIKPVNLATAIALGQTQQALKMIVELEESGINWSNFVTEMLRFYQRELEAQFGIGQSSTELTITQIRQASILVGQAGLEMNKSSVPSLPLELAVIGNTLVNETKTSKDTKPPARKKNFDSAALPTAATNLDQAPEPTKVSLPKTDKPMELATVIAKWSEIIATCGPKNHSVAGLLRGVVPKAIQGQDLVLEVFYKFHKEQLEVDSKTKVLEEVLEQVVGPLRVRCVLGERTARTLAENVADDNIGSPEIDAAQIAAVEKVFGLVN